MDEEYDVRLFAGIAQTRVNGAVIGRRSRYRPDRVHPLRSPVRRGQEGPPHGPQRLLRR